MTTDGQVIHAFPAYRVFIFGQEVTDDVTSCNVTYNDGRSPNTLDITLASPDDRYVITEKDILTLYKNTLKYEDIYFRVWKDHRGTQAEIDAVDAYARLQTSIHSNIEANISDEIKRAIVLAKFDKRVKVAASELSADYKEYNLKTLEQLTGEGLRYPFQVGDCIFHSSDAVRVFWRDPFDPTQWHHMFAGFVTDWSEDSSVNHASTVKIRFEDPTRILRHARMTMQPGFFDIDALKQAVDAAIRSVWSDGFTNLSVSELLFTMLFGVDTAGTQGVGTESHTSGANGKVDTKFAGVEAWTDSRYGVHAGEGTTVRLPSDGIGAFNFAQSQIFYFGKKPTKKPEVDISKVLQGIVEEGDVTIASYLEDPRVDTRVLLTDLEQLASDDIRKTGIVEWRRLNIVKTYPNAAEQQEQIITEIGEHPELYPVDGGGLLMLIPASLGPEFDKSILMKDINTNSMVMQTKWTTRLGVIYDMLERIDFSFHASPKGHLLCEMPLYDFDPQTLGRPELIVHETEQVQWSRSFSEENVKTLMSSTWFIAAGWAALGTAFQAAAAPAVVVRKSLIAQFGVRAEVTEPTGFIASEEVAKVFAEVKLNQLNANVRTAQIEMIPRMGILPNRPVYFKGREFIGTARSVKHSLTWNSSMSTDIDVNYIRGWDGLTRKDKGSGKQFKVFTQLGGIATSALNYALLHKDESIETATSNKIKDD